jgi:hypothetical protein
MGEKSEVYARENVTSPEGGGFSSQQRQTQTNRRYLRVLPALVVYSVFEAVLLVFLYWSDFEHLGLV